MKNKDLTILSDRGGSRSLSRGVDFQKNLKIMSIFF